MEFPIDLVPIAMGDVCVIFGINWLSRFGAVIDYTQQMVTIRDPSGGVLIVYDEGTRSESAFYYAARESQSLQWECIGGLTYVMDTRVTTKRSRSISDVPVVCDFLEFFHE